MCSSGWLSDSTATLFNDYANFCYMTFGDRVKTWITIHDPYSISWKGYGSGEHAPGNYVTWLLLLVSHKTCKRYGGRSATLVWSSHNPSYNSYHRSNSCSYYPSKVVKVTIADTIVLYSKKKSMICIQLQVDVSIFESYKTTWSYCILKMRN